MEIGSLIQILLSEFYNKITNLKDIVLRDAQLPQAQDKIKVAIGIRRSGKTYFLYQYILELLAQGVDKSSILYINFEDDRLFPLEQQKLGQLVDAFYSYYPQNHDRKCFLFLDEIQNVDNWPTVIRRLHDTKNVEIFLTGSSAKLLSKEIATGLRGRSLSREIWPYSFDEFIRARKIEIDKALFDKKAHDLLASEFTKYLTNGGFPEVIPYSQSVRQQTLQEYLDIVIYRDIVERHSIKSPNVIKYMILSLMHNAGKPFSVNKFYNDLKTRGFQVGKDTLYEYAEHIEDAYLAFFVPLYSESIRKIHTNPQKIYSIDPGMARALTLDYENDLGRLFENIVFIDLRRLGCKVYYYLTKERYEVDFLVETGRGEKKLFQVAWNIQDEKTFQREKRALESGMKELKVDGEIVTLDSYLQKGIKLS